MRIAVFCGSSSGRRPEFLQAATVLGQLLAQQGIGIVYGGASVGLMGAVATAARQAGGEVIGVLPQSLMDRELAHTGLSELHIVETMHERKAKMSELADAFLALPGGIGTFEELFEVWTWGVLGYHRKPCALLNVAGFYDGLVSFLDHVVEDEFLKPVYRNMLLVDESPEALLKALFEYVPPAAPKWTDSEEKGSKPPFAEAAEG